MSGGGNRPIKGRMSSKLRSDVSPQELTGMEKKIQQDEEALEVCMCIGMMVWNEDEINERVEKES